MGQDLSAAVQRQIERARADPAVQAVVEISIPRFRTLLGSTPPRRILFLTKENTYRRRIEVAKNKDRAELWWFPYREARRALSQEGWDSTDFGVVRFHLDRTGGKMASDLRKRQQDGPSRPARYSADVKYLAYRKILRIAEDARKHAEQGSWGNARLLLWMSLLHLARYTYVRKDSPIPPRIRIAEDLRRDRCELGSLLRKASEREGVEPALNQLFHLLRQHEVDYSWPAWRWESKALRFGKGFGFDDLVFSESDCWLWKVWDRFLSRPTPILPQLERVQRINPTSLKELKSEISSLVEGLPEITGALVIGSSARLDGALGDQSSSDLDLVLFTGGLYLKRFFFQIQQVLVDGIVISEKAARLGLRHRAPMVVIGCGNGEIVFDRHGALKRMQKEAQAAYREGPPPISPGEIEYALVASEGNMNQLTSALEDRDPGNLFLLFEEFIRVLYLSVEALGVWVMGEQRILPSLQEQKPEVARAFEGCLQGEESSVDASLGLLIGRLKETLGMGECITMAESHRRLPLCFCFDL